MSDSSRGVNLLALVHAQSGLTRAAAARLLGIGSGQAAEVVARLVADELVSEGASAPTGSRGRPSPELLPHPRGPLALAVNVDQHSWQVAVLALGCRVIELRQGDHDRRVEPTLIAIERAATSLRRSYEKRIRATAVAVPGTVREDVLLQASGLGWLDVSLDALRPSRSKRPFLVGNDASFAAVAEARRGAGVGARSMLYLYFDSGLGGALVEDGRLVSGASGVAGEFGHLPFGDPRAQCPCGARGCWNTSIDAAALARLLGRTTTSARSGFTAGVLAAAQAGDAVSLAAVEHIGAVVGRGVAGLVNALDPALISLGGLGGELLELPRRSLEQAYSDGLMQFHRRRPPPMVVGALGTQAPLIGAAEECFDRLLTRSELVAWSAR